MSAFVPSSFTPPGLTTSFTGKAVIQNSSRVCQTASPSTILAISYNSIDKYTKMSTPQMNGIPTGSKPSSVWAKYLASTKERMNPTRSAEGPGTAINKVPKPVVAVYNPYVNILNLAVIAKKGLGGDPLKMCTKSPNVDAYMAKCVTMQYKMTAAPNGVYAVKCTEGTYKGQAEEARTSALALEFKLKTRNTSAKFADYTETRRKAIIAAKGCSHEETMISKYPAAAKAMVTGGSEAKSTCVRYAVGMSPEETYMAACVDKQMKFRAAPMGVYDVMCADGTVHGMAEYRRVSSLSAKFKAGQMSQSAKEQMKFDAAKYARENYGHGCSYEETFFNKYPAVAISMRPSFARY